MYTLEDLQKALRLDDDVMHKRTVRIYPFSSPEELHYSIQCIMISEVHSSLVYGRGDNGYDDLDDLTDEQVVEFINTHWERINKNVTEMINDFTESDMLPDLAEPYGDWFREYILVDMHDLLFPGHLLRE